MSKGKQGSFAHDGAEISKKSNNQETSQRVNKAQNNSTKIENTPKSPKEN